MEKTKPTLETEMTETNDISKCPIMQDKSNGDKCPVKHNGDQKMELPQGHEQFADKDIS